MKIYTAFTHFTIAGYQSTLSSALVNIPSWFYFQKKPQSRTQEAKNNFNPHQVLFMPYGVYYRRAPGKLTFEVSSLQWINRRKPYLRGRLRKRTRSYTTCRKNSRRLAKMRTCAATLDCNASKNLGNDRRRGARNARTEVRKFSTSDNSCAFEEISEFLKKLNKDTLDLLYESDTYVSRKTWVKVMKAVFILST